MLERPIKFKLAYADGCHFLSFIQYSLRDKDLIVYALSDDRETHAAIAQFAVDEEIVSESQEPVAGGIFNAKTGQAQDNIVDSISLKLEDIICRE